MHDRNPSAAVQEAVQEAPASRAEAMLLEFLVEHEAACPVCGYNLKTLTRPICPECGSELVLTVGATRLRLGWLFVALAPGFFSGIAAGFLLIPIVLRYVVGDGGWSHLLNLVDLFGWCSGVFAILLAWKRHRFLALPRGQQMMFALAIWAIHVTVLMVFLLMIRRWL